MFDEIGYLPKAILVVALATLVGAWPAYALGGEDGLVGLSLAGAASLLGALAGRIPHLLFRRGPTALLNAALAGLGVRLLVTLSLAVPLLLLAPYPLESMAIGLVLSYLSLLVLEVRDLVVRSRRPTDAASTQSESLTPGTDGAPTR